MSLKIGSLVIGVFCFTALVELSLAQASTGLRGAITSAPDAAAVGSEIRVGAILHNGGTRPVAVQAQIWLVRPGGGAHGLGRVEVALRPGQRTAVVIPGKIGSDAALGPNRLALVIVAQPGRFIADSRSIRILPAVQSSRPIPIPIRPGHSSPARTVRSR